MGLFNYKDELKYYPKNDNLSFLQVSEKQLKKFKSSKKLIVDKNNQFIFACELSRLTTKCDYVLVLETEKIRKYVDNGTIAFAGNRCFKIIDPDVSYLVAESICTILKTALVINYNCDLEACVNDELSKGFELKDTLNYYDVSSDIWKLTNTAFGKLYESQLEESVEDQELIDLSNMSDLDQEAKSKSQRRLFAMALAYKKGKLDSKYASDQIKKMSNMDEDTLREFAETKQKKRKKDGSISKRNNIPQKVKKSKK